jgi:hypothetical protein
MKNTGLIVALSLAAAGSVVGRGAQQRPSGPAQVRATALVGGTLIDGAGGQPIRNSVVLIRGDRIERVGTVESLPVPSGYERISTEGMTVLPGLWDLHVHLLYGGHPNTRYWFDTYASQFERVTIPASAEQLLMAGVTSGAVSTDILHLPARVVVITMAHLTSADAPRCLRRVERRERTVDDHPHEDSSPPSAALRPPASGARPTHGGRDHRHGSRGPSLDGPWVAWQGTEGRGWPRRDGPEGLGTSTRSPEAPATREETHGTPSTRAGPAAKLEVRVDARAPAPRRREDKDPVSRGSSR